MTVTITIHVPDSALSTDEALVTVKATSTYGSTSDADGLEVGVHQHHSLKVVIDFNSVEIDKGESKDAFATITITNEGNGPETVRVSFSGDITGYLTSSTPKVDLQPDETKVVKLSVAVVDSAPSGVASGTISVASTKSPAKETLEFEVIIKGGSDGGSFIDIDPLYIYILIAVIVIVAALSATVTRKKRPGNSRKLAKV